MTSTEQQGFLDGYLYKQAADVPEQPGKLYMGSRRVKLWAPGRHQYVVGVPKDPSRFPEAVMQNGVPTVTLGGYPRTSGGSFSYLAPKKLTALTNSPTDVREHRGVGHQLHELPVEDSDAALRKMLDVSNAYAVRTAVNPVKYSKTYGLCGGKVCNSYVQAMLEAAGLKQKGQQLDVPGWHPGQGRQPDSELFQPLEFGPEQDASVSPEIRGTV